jgi:hypothetical protein
LEQYYKYNQELRVREENNFFWEEAKKHTRHNNFYCSSAKHQNIAYIHVVVSKR